MQNKPLLLRIDLKTSACTDEAGTEYKLDSLDDAVKEYSSGDDNIQSRLTYDWRKLVLENTNIETTLKKKKQTEFIGFLKKFLFKNLDEFTIAGKKVVDVENSGSGGPDVNLIFEDGTNQWVELEHEWKNYIDHGHHKDNAWEGVWIFAEEPWNFETIFKLFRDLKIECNDRVPDVFLWGDGEVRSAHKIYWEKKSCLELPIKAKQ